MKYTVSICVRRNDVVVEGFDVDVVVVDELTARKTFNEIVTLLEKRFGRDKVMA